MADRTSAAAFGVFFEFLAETPDDRSKAMAAKMWAKIEGYDFSPGQMYVDDALKVLGLFREIRAENASEDEIEYQYGPEEK